MIGSGARALAAPTLVAAILSLSAACVARAPTVLRYAHMNARDSVAGIQADSSRSGPRRSAKAG